MSGLVKAKKYDWKDSNMSMVGSDTDRSVKKESAETEPAWEGAGQEVGIQIWRIVKFEVKHWPKEDYGKFYSGDSYIILNTYNESDSDELLYDVHFWIGKYSTQDEYGTAAYKTVELDCLLDDKPVQHREVQSHESDMFKEYFPTMMIMEGGAETGFRHVTPEQYQPRLLHFSGVKRNVVVKEVPMARSKVNSGDVFILDKGLKIIQWNGSGSSKDERFKAMQFLQQLRSERNGRPEIETVDEDGLSGAHEFYQSLPDDIEDEDDDDATDAAHDPKLFRVSDSSGSMEFALEKEGPVSAGDLDTNDVFIMDMGTDIFMWIGKGASVEERRRCMNILHKYTGESSNPFAPFTCVSEGQKNKAFSNALAA